MVSYGGSAAKRPDSGSQASFETLSEVMFYSRLFVLILLLIGLLMPGWESFFGSGSGRAYGVFWVSLSVTVGTYLLRKTKLFARPMAFVSLLMDFALISYWAIPSGGLRSPFMAGFFLICFYLLRLWPQRQVLWVPGSLLGVISLMQLRLRPEADWMEHVFLLLWYVLLLLLLAYALGVRLWGEAQVEREEAKALTQATRLAIITEERLRLAREIHDGLGGNLSSLIMQVEYVARANRDPALQGEIAQIKAEADEAIEELRRSLTMMRRDFDLHKALEDYCLRFEERSDTRCDFQVRGQPRRLPSEMQLGVFRVLQECLTNVQKHAEAKFVKVRLRYPEYNLVSLSVEDDGLGFEPSEAESPGHYGLINLSERAKKFRGTVDIQSQAGEGSRITVSLVIPLEGSHVAFLPDA